MVRTFAMACGITCGLGLVYLAGALTGPALLPHAARAATAPEISETLFAHNFCVVDDKNNPVAAFGVRDGCTRLAMYHPGNDQKQFMLITDRDGMTMGLRDGKGAMRIMLYADTKVGGVMNFYNEEEKKVFVLPPLR